MKACGKMRFDVLTVHPDMCTGPISVSILARAIESGLIDVNVHDIRDHGIGKHRTVDDTPYGGGSGMVLRVDVVDKAIQAVSSPRAHVILMDASGKRFDQSDARRLAGFDHLVFVCGHYEGIDSRVRQHLADEVISIGDYVLTGGELPALVVIDAVSRMLPGVLGNPESILEESFMDGGLEAAPYTRPRQYREWCVPEVLTSGDHERIHQWRRAQSEQLTRRVRPDLLDDDDN